MNKSVCFYFQVHQPDRLRQFRFFDIGNDYHYLDDFSNRTIVRRIAERCYLPANRLLHDLILRNNGAFKVAFSISGVAIEQFERYAPEVIDSFKALAATGCVEFLSETYSHSLASLASMTEFKKQVKQHADLMKRTFGVKPTVFRNTELVYSDAIGAAVAEMGY
ncbi:MAG: polysaccharide deacetylase family protein, partial [Bacteroidales bacterium]|nr:polysaccharide deacetylase family protein [Bacteroidales bacterium]